MFSKLAGLASFSILVVACSGAPAPTGTGQPEQTEGTTLPPAKDGEKSTSNDEGSTGGDAKTTDPSQTNDPGKPGQNGGDGKPGQPGQNGGDGQPGRVSVNEHCCYGGTYYKCPSSNACFGGFDIGACLDTCASPFEPCWDECFDKLSNAGPPAGCQQTAEPAGIDCANGKINTN